MICPKCKEEWCSRIARPLWVRLVPNLRYYECDTCFHKWAAFFREPPAVAADLPESSAWQARVPEARLTDPEPSGGSCREIAAGTSYEAFFGLTRPPFGIAPDPSFIFLTPQHRQVFSEIMHGIERRKGFIVVTGEIGAGKSTLCRVLLEHLGSSVETAMIVNPDLPDVQLLAAVLDDFGVPVSGTEKRDYLRALNEFLLGVAQRGSTCVLLLDESQSMSPAALEAVRMLSNCETNTQKLLQIVLMGQPELLDIIEKPSLTQLYQRVSIWCHLSNLSRKETGAYIEHRLNVAGRTGERIFEESAVDAIHAYTKGGPRLINVVCDRALLLACLDGQETIGPKLIMTAIDRPRGNPGRAQGSAGGLVA